MPAIGWLLIIVAVSGLFAATLDLTIITGLPPSLAWLLGVLPVATFAILYFS